MRRDWIRGPVDFGGKVEYACVSGYLLRDDPTSDRFTVVCQEDGTYNFTQGMICVKGRFQTHTQKKKGNKLSILSATETFCSVEPPAVPKNGFRVWSGETVVGTKAHYSCGAYGVLPGGISVLDAECLWNSTWSRNSTIECICELWSRPDPTLFIYERDHEREAV